MKYEVRTIQKGIPIDGTEEMISDETLIKVEGEFEALHNAQLFAKAIEDRINKECGFVYREWNPTVHIFEITSSGEIEITEKDDDFAVFVEEKIKDYYGIPGSNPELWMILRDKYNDFRKEFEDLRPYVQAEIAVKAAQLHGMLNLMKSLGDPCYEDWERRYIPFIVAKRMRNIGLLTRGNL